VNFGKIEHNKPAMDAILNFKTQLYQTFYRFFSQFVKILAQKLQKVVIL
jgi:hypothetical protein